LIEVRGSRVWWKVSYGIEVAGCRGGKRIGSWDVETYDAMRLCDMHCGSTKIVGLVRDEMTLFYKNKNRPEGNNLIFYCM
jgi:hypothetical protein